LLRRAVWKKFTDVSEVLAASNIRAMSTIIALTREAASASATLVNFYQNTRCNNPEYSQLHTRRRENLKSPEVTYVVSAVIYSVVIQILKQMPKNYICVEFIHRFTMGVLFLASFLWTHFSQFTAICLLFIILNRVL
jgi:hypothetical protein